MGMFLSIWYVPGKCQTTWEVVPREVETFAKVCTAKEQLSMARNKSHVTPFGVIIVVIAGVSVCVKVQRTTFRSLFSPSALCVRDKSQVCMASIFFFF